MTEQVEYVVVGLGAFGSATTYHLARGGAEVVGLEQFELGHVRGASHDTSRILRHSYHSPGYVALTFAAYDDWGDLERAAGEPLVTVVGGLDLFPSDASVPVTDHTEALAAHGVPFEVLERDDVQQGMQALGRSSAAAHGSRPCHCGPGAGMDAAGTAHGGRATVARGNGQERKHVCLSSRSMTTISIPIS